MITQKQQIKVWLRKSINYLRARRGEVNAVIRWDKYKHELLVMHEENPNKYEEMCEELENRLKNKQFIVNVLTEIIKRKKK